MYDRRITRANPALVVLLVDQSTSMVAGIFGRDHQSKADFVADALNAALGNMVLACARDEGVRDYFHVVGLGYGDTVDRLFDVDEEVVPISVLGENPRRLEQRNILAPDGVGGTSERPIQLPVWIEPTSHGLTSMTAALERTAKIAEEWVREFPGGFPPIVMNITDGGATDGDPVVAAERLRRVENGDGATLLFNVHVSSAGGAGVSYPRTLDELAHVDDPLADVLFEMSSVLPPIMVERAASTGLPLRVGSRAMTYLADASELVRTLDLGTATVPASG